MANYILDSNGEPQLEDDPLKWAMWFEAAGDLRRVAHDAFDGVIVSTVFLGIDHSCSEAWPPILWETMIFGGPQDNYQRRYTSRCDAIVGHMEVVQLVLHTWRAAFDCVLHTMLRWFIR